MKRRRLVALVSVAVLFALGIAAVSVLLVATRTDYGHEQLRKRLVAPLFASAVHGSVHVGRLGGNLLDSVTIDTLAIRDKDGALFLSTGKVTIKFDPRDFWDRRIYVRRAQVEHPWVHIVERANGKWNFHDIFGSDTPGPPRSATSRGWGSYVVIDSLRGRQGTFLLSLRWHPDDSLRGPKRDSAVTFNLARADHDIDATSDGYKKTYHWTNIYGLVSHARLADPDSDREFGRWVKIDTLHVDELDPPFKFRNARGEFRHLGDSVWFQAPHFDLPASTGSALGKLVWGSNLPVRYDVAVRGDSVALNDVNWVYPYLPRSGGGTMLLRIKNDPKNINVIDFKLTQMDVRSTKSHVLGDMSFGVGAPVLLVRDVNLKGDPVDFDLIRTFNGKPFPVDWQGQLFGTVKGRGGPLTHFTVDDMRAVWRDTHVPGAESRFSGRGELDIFAPAFTAFHGFDVDVGSLDLRSIEYLFPSFPRLRGTMSGTARLDSSWLDVRFSNARVAWQDGPGDPSRLTGSGRVTYGDPYMIYDVALNAEPLSLTTLARSYPGLPFRGLVSGPIRARGTSPDLELTTSLQGPSGALSFEGKVDVDSVGGYGAHGRGQFSEINVAQLLERGTIPVGTLSGHYDVDVAGETAADLRGRADLELERTMFDSIRIHPSRASLRFADGRIYVDSLRLPTSAGTAIVQGAIGLPKGRSDSALTVLVNVDSLGGLRRYLGRVVVLPTGETTPDSLAGRLTLTATVRGRVDSLDVSGKVNGSELFLRSAQGLGLAGTFDIRNALTAPTGSLVFRADSLQLGGIALDTLGGTITVVDRTHATFVAAAARLNGPSGGATGEMALVPGGQSVRVDSLGVEIGGSFWHLASPARFTADSLGFSLDSLLVRNADSAFIAMSGVVPNVGPVSARLRAGSIPLKDAGVLAKYAKPVSGLAELTMQVSGTKLAPDITASAALSNVQTGSLEVERVTSTGAYRGGRFTGDLDLYLKGQNALHATATIPVNLTMFSASMSKDPLNIALRTDSAGADLSIIELLGLRTIEKPSGRLDMKIEMAGRWGPRDSLLASLAPTGYLKLERGQLTVKPLGISLTNAHADIQLRKDTLRVVDVSATSANGRANNRIGLSGSIANPWAPARRSYALELDAVDFRAVDKRTLARLEVSTASTPLRLTGAGNAVALTGGLLVDHSQLYLPDPELARKRLVDIEADTIAGGLPSGDKTGALLAKYGLKSVGVTVNLGEDVKLRSKEADIRLGGSVTIGMQRTLASSVRTGGREEPTYPLTVDGELLARGGTYTLDLGLARRDFTVTDGRVSFDGSTNPDIDISALYNVKRYKQQDIGVIVHVKGPLIPGPVIDFSSNQQYDISQSDLVSYLVTGEPGFDALAGGNQGGAYQTLATFLAPTASSLLTSALRQSLGSIVDLVQFQGAGTDRSQSAINAGSTLGDFFAGGSLSAQTQLSPNLFFSLSAGLCQLDLRGGGTRVNQSPLDAFGGKLEYRFKPDLSMQTGREPSTQARYCGSGPLLGTVGTPSQWSLSLLKSWRF